MVSEEIQELDLLRMDDRLNPCFGGRWSRSEIQELDLLRMDVLILVLVEDGLGGDSRTRLAPYGRQS